MPTPPTGHIADLTGCIQTQSTLTDHRMDVRRPCPRTTHCRPSSHRGQFWSCSVSSAWPPQSETHPPASTPHVDHYDIDKDIDATQPLMFVQGSSLVNLLWLQPAGPSKATTRVSTEALQGSSELHAVIVMDNIWWRVNKWVQCLYWFTIRCLLILTI